MTDNLKQQFNQQQFANDYQLIDCVVMYTEQGDNFQIPHPVLKKHVGIDHFVELRIDSPRFSVHEDAPEKCNCPTCNGEMTKPILSHNHPASLVPIPEQNVPSRGWGEDFWVQITERDGVLFKGGVDNPLYEARLHEVHQGDEIVFNEDHILAVHPSHRRELVLGMDLNRFPCRKTLFLVLVWSSFEIEFSCKDASVELSNQAGARVNLDRIERRW